MTKLAILLTKEPYGLINAAEAVRHALGAPGEEFDITLILSDGGVQLSAKGQDEAGSGFTNLGESLRYCIEAGAKVLADKESLRKAGRSIDDIEEGVEPVESSRISGVIKGADKTMIF